MSYDIAEIVMLVMINIACLTLMLWVLRSSISKRINQIFAIMVLFIIFWVNFSYLGSSVVNSDLSTLFYRLNEGSVSIFIFIFYYFFVYMLLRVDGQNYIKYPILAGSLFFSLISIFTPLIIQNTNVLGNSSEIVFGELNMFFNIFAITIAVILLVYALKRFPKLLVREKQMVKLFFVGTIVFILANVIFSALVPAIIGSTRYQHLGDFSFIFFLGFTAYAIVKNRLFDVKFAVIRSVTYTLVLVALASIYLLLTAVLSAIFNGQLTEPWQTISGAVISLTMVFAFQPLKRFFDKLTNNVFYKDRYHTDDFYSRLNDALT